MFGKKEQKSKKVDCILDEINEYETI